jgi:MerR family transcriptional regulator, light-induced transcriptional regulator
MYTIKQAAVRSGVPVQLLRAWERRYGVVRPERTGSGYRLYDETAIDRLRAMRQLIAEGWTASTAAMRVRELDDSAVAELAGRLAAARPTPSAPEPDGTAALALREAFVEAAGRLDEPSFERILDEMFARGSFEQVASELVMPALVDLGQAWADGRVDVAGEHAASSAVQRRLGMAFMAAGAPLEHGDVVLVGMAPGARHDLGALAFATTARRSGLVVRFLGADLPVEDWVEAARRTDAIAAVVGIVMRADVKPALEVARAIRGANPAIRIAYGGHRAGLIPAEALDGALILPESLPEAVASLSKALAAAASEEPWRG